MARTPLVVDIGPLRETHYTGIPNVIAEICSRLLKEPWLELFFDLDGRWIETASLQHCLEERSGQSLGGAAGRFRPADAIRTHLAEANRLGETVGLFTDHRPPRKLFPREGKLVYDLSMILAPECHPAESVRLYTTDLEEQIACSDVLFCISEATARDLAWIYGVEASRLKVVPLGNTVDTTWPARLRGHFGNRPIEPYLIVLGSIEPRKNAALVLEWLACHPEVLDRIRLLFVGRQAWGERFAEIVLAKDLGPQVDQGRLVYVGFADEVLKGGLLAGAAGLLYPSVFEGFGLPLLEAAAIGTPVLASVSTSMPEVIGDGAYYFDPCSVASLHDAFSHFWADRSSGRVADTAAKACAHVRRFNYDETYKAIIKGLFPSAALP